MNFENLLVEKKNRIAVVTINRPANLNALNKQTISELNNCFNLLEADSEIRCIVLTGGGEKSFVAGADIKEFANFSQAQGQELSAEGHHLLFNLVEHLSTPVIAAINGFALGGGLELAMACHFRIASDNARLGLPEVTLGVIPGYGGTQRLTSLVGKGKALQMILTAGMINAQEALQWGLVNEVVAQTELLSRAEALAEQISKNSPNAISAAIKAVNAGFIGLEVGLRKEIEMFGSCFGTPDFEEGTKAFIEKRKPEF